MSDHEQENQNPNVGGPSSDSGDTRKDAYKVGYCRPPMHSRFKPGQSGYPKGRSAGRPNAKTTIQRVMNEKVVIREGNKTRRMSKFEAMVQTHTMKGMKGDGRSANAMIGLMGRNGLFADQEAGATIEGMPGGAPIKMRLGDALFDNIDEGLLSTVEMIELSRLAGIIDSAGDITALSTSDFERLKELVNKGRGNDDPAPTK